MHPIDTLRAVVLVVWAAITAPRRARRVWQRLCDRHPRCAERILDTLVYGSVVALVAALAVMIFAEWTGPAVTAIAALGVPGSIGLYAGAVLVGEV
jgi:hypothetical protein